MSAATYALDNDHRAAADHHQALAALLDPDTRARIVGLRDGWSRVRRCLEIGAGAGSMSRWLAEQVGPDALVVACDLKPDLICPHPQVETIAHDLTSGIPLVDVVDRGYELILARMTLQHLPNRRTVLHELAGLLTPGGTLLVEDWAALRECDEVVVIAPSVEAEALYRRYQKTIGDVFDAAGADRRWARRVYQYMREEGLVEVSTIYKGGYWVGGDPGLHLVATAAAQLRPRLLAAGFTADDLDQLVELTLNPGLVVHGHPLYSTSGVKPPGN